MTTHARATNPYAELLAIGAEIDSHEADLYVRATPETVKLVKNTGWGFTYFKSEIDGRLWLDVPFAFIPFWGKKPYREEHCTHLEKAWCDCDWCRVVRGGRGEGGVK